PEVVDLTVEDEHEAPGGRHHRLGPGGRKIQGREPPMAEGDPRVAIDPRSAVVGTAMPDDIRHRRGDSGCLVRVKPARLQVACDAAHVRSPPHELGYPGEHEDTGPAIGHFRSRAGPW